MKEHFINTEAQRHRDVQALAVCFPPLRLRASALKNVLFIRRETESLMNNKFNAEAQRRKGLNTPRSVVSPLRLCASALKNNLYIRRSAR
jgi:hypothetical protein